MSYFQNFPSVQYQFDDENIKLFKNISIRPAIREELLLAEAEQLQPYYVQSGETPETVAYDYYNDVNMNWVIMLSNNIMNLYTDWPMSDGQLKSYMYDKYRVQPDSDGVERTLTDEQIYEFISFVGSPSNNYKGAIDLDSENGPKVVIRPHHFTDEDNNEYSVGSINATADAFGRTITTPTLTPVSHEDYEVGLNDEKRKIFIPSSQIARKMKKELSQLLNE